MLKPLADKRTTIINAKSTTLTLHFCKFTGNHCNAVKCQQEKKQV